MSSVSVIIPTYNNLELFKRCLNSVRYQKDVEFEIIVVDDSTTKDIEEFINRLSVSNLKFIKNQPPKGAVKNWNFGLTLAKKKFIILLHHDEALEDKHYQLINLLNSIKENDIIISKVIIHRNDVKTERSKFLRKLVIKISLFNPSILTIYNTVGPVSCLMFKKEILEYFNEEMRSIVDTEWYYRLIHKNNVIFDDDFHIHSEFGHQTSITNNINTLDEIRKDLVQIKKNYSPYSLIYLSGLFRFLYLFLKFLILKR